MKKITKYALLAAFMAITTASFAQKKFGVMINTGYNYAIGHSLSDVGYNNLANIGTFSSSLIPLGLRFTYEVSEKFVVNAGYAFNIPASSYKGREIDDASTINAKLHQITVGANYYFTTTRLRPFIGLDLGVGITRYVSKLKGFILPFADRITLNQTGFLFSPKVGVDYDLSDHWYLNADLHYIGVTGGKLTARNITGTGKVGFNHLIGLNVGIGYRF